MKHRPSAGSRSTPCSTARPARAAMALALEPRFLLDAAAVATGAEAAAEQAAQDAAAQPVDTDAGAQANSDAIAEALASMSAAAAAPTTAAPPAEILFIDTRVPDWQSIRDAAAPGAEVILIDTGSDGVKQIATALQGRSDITSISIVSHGDEGVLLLGNAPLFSGNLANYTSELQTIGNALSADGDILLYGCDVGAGSQGGAFIQALASATGADVAASTNGTGGVQRGADWDLEISTGSIEPSGSLDTTRLADYDHVLVTASVNSVAQLKAAIATGNSDGVADVITFTGNITFASAADAIAINVTDGQTLSIVGGGFTLSGNNLARVLDVATSGGGSAVAIDNLTISNGFLTGNGGDIGNNTTGGDGGDALGAGIRNSGVLTITGSTITAHKAAGGGGGGSQVGGGAGAGGGGGGFGTTFGGAGGANPPHTAGAASAGTGGNGAGYATFGGGGGSTSGGAGSTYGYGGYTTGGNGGTGSNGSISIGGGGGGAGYDRGGGRGGNAAGAIYNTGTLTITGSSVTNSIAAGGGGGGGAHNNSANSGDGGAGGAAVAAVWNAGGTVQMDAGTHATLATGNAAGAGAGGTTTDPGSSNGAAGTATSQIWTTNGGTTDTNYVANATPTLGNLNGDSVAWAGVGSSVTLDSGGNADLGDTDLEALNGGNGDWSGASLTVQRAGTAVASDTLGFDTAGALFTVSGGNLQSGGLTFATFTNTGGVLNISFTSSGTTATTALVNDVAQRITYRNDTPAGDATLRFALSDGSANTTADITVSSDTIYITNTTDTAAIDFSNGVSFSEAIAIAAADATGSQTLVIANSLAGQTVSTAAASSLGENLTLDLDAASGVTLSGGTLSIGGGAQLTITNGSGDSATLATALAGAGALSKSGAGNLTLSGTNSYSGATTVAAGTLDLSGGDAIATSSSVAVTSGATLTLSADETIGNLSGAGSINLGSSTLTSNLSADTTFAGNISGSGGLTVNQTGAATFALTLSGTNTYTGTTITVNFGWLRLDGDGAISNSSQLRVNGNSVVTLLSDQTIGSLSSNNANATVQLGNFTLSAGGDNSSSTMSGVISGSGNLVKQGSGTLTLGGSNTYSGSTTVVAGTLSVGSDANLGSGAVGLASGSTLEITGATTIDNAISLAGDATVSNTTSATLSGVISGVGGLTKAGSGVLALSGTNTYSGSTNISAGTLSVGSDSNLGSGTLTLSSATTLAVTGVTNIDNSLVLAGNASIDTSAATTLSGIIGGAGSLTKSGAAALTLAGSNTYSGSTTVNAGTLSVASDSNLGSGGLTLGIGTTLAVSGATTIDNALALAGNAVVSSLANTVLTGVISGAGNLTKSGAATLTLGGTNTYSGSTTVNAGTLSLASDSNLGSGTLVLATGSTLALTGATTIDNAITLSGNATVNTTADATLSGNIGSAGGLAKTGSSTLTLSGNTSYIGATSIAAGTLVVDGALAGTSAVTVASGATLGGGGNLFAPASNNTLLVQSGGTLAPSGTLTVNGNLQMNAGSTLAVDIGGTSAGNDYGQIIVLGSVDVNGATLAVNHGYAPGQGDVYTLIDNDAADAITGTLSSLTEGATFSAAGNGTQLTVSYIGGSGNELTLTAPINSAPTLANLNGDNVTFTQGGDATVLDDGGNATLSDADSPDFDGGNVTVTIIGNGVAGEDLLSVRHQGSGAGEIGLSAANVTYGGVLIGTLAGGSGGTDLVITLNANATPAAVQALVRNLTYGNGNISNAIDQATRTLRITVNDGDGGTSSNTDVSVAVVETVPPTATIVVADTALAIGETSTVTITFSEAVTGLTLGDFSVASGALSGLSSGDGGITWTATLTPTANIADTSNLITLDNSGVMDATGNAGSGTTDSNNYTVDTQRPTATIAVADDTLAIGESSTVTITFSEAVSGLTIGDFSVANGVLSGLSSGDGGTTWTATLTPAANVTDTSNLITLDNSGVMDAAGNAGSGATNSNNYAVDTQRLTATIAVADTALAAGESSAVTITFSEVVSGLTIDDFSVANGVLSGLSSSDGGITWTATLTPTANVTDTSNLITLDNSGVMDAAGNAGSGTTDSNNYTVDTQRPTATIAVADDTLAIGESSAVTITFSEAVSGLTIGDFSVANGLLSNLASADGGRTWSALFTPTTGISDTTNTIVLDQNGVQDAAGNSGSGTALSNNYVIDTEAPRYSIAAVSGSTTTVIFAVAFTEPVSGVDTGDFVLTPSDSAEGRIASVSSSDGGRTWLVGVDGVAGDGALSLDLAVGSGIVDAAGNALGSGNAGSVSISSLPPPPLPEPPPPIGTGGPFIPPPTPTAAPALTLTATDAPTLSTLNPPISGSAFSSAPPPNLVIAPLTGGSDSVIPPAAFTRFAEPTPVAPISAGSSLQAGGYVETGAGNGGGLQALPTLGAQTISTAEPFTFTLPRATFSHSERGAAISVEARLANGRPLPGWLRFDPATGTFSGQPPGGPEQKLQIEVIGRDSKGNRATTRLEITVESARPDNAANHLPDATAERLATLLQALQAEHPAERADGLPAAPGFAAQLAALADTVERDAERLAAALEQHFAGA